MKRAWSITHRRRRKSRLRDCPWEPTMNCCSRLQKILSDVWYPKSAISDICHQTWWYQRSDIRRRYIYVYQTSATKSLTTDVWDIIHMTLDIWYNTSDITHLNSDNKQQTSSITRLVSDIWNQTSDIRRLITDVRIQTDITQQKSDVCYQMFDII